jgi:negative regulator of sigma E activity
MMKRVKIAALALAAGTLTAAGAKPAQYSLDPLLGVAISAPSTISYTGVVEVVRMGSHVADAAVYRVEHRAPDLTRRDYMAPSALSGDWVVTKGDLAFSVEPRRRRILETRNDAADDSAALDANYALLRKNYRVVRTGSDSVAGRSTIDLALISNYSRRTTMLIRVDSASKCVLEKEEFAPDGAPVSELRFEAIRYSTQRPAADFALPKAYAVVRGASLGEPPQPPDRVLGSAGFAAREPRTLPDGFSPVDGNLVDLRGVRTVHLLYSDGLRTVSLFESARASTLEATRFAPRWVRVGARSAEYAEDGAMALLAWSDGALYYTLVAEVGLVDLQRVAASIGR